MTNPARKKALLAFSLDKPAIQSSGPQPVDLRTEVAQRLKRRYLAPRILGMLVLVFLVLLLNLSATAAKHITVFWRNVVSLYRG